MKIINRDLAKSMDGDVHATGGGSLMGTPSFMSPEQFRGVEVDHRADVYALGAMAYEMLAGRPPFTGMSAQAVLAVHVTQTPEPVTGLRPAIPAALGGLIMRCVEKRPADRWQTADELVPHLEALLTPSGGTAPTVATSALSSGTEAAVERRDPVRVTVLFALGSAAALTLTWWLVRQIGLPDWVVLAAGEPLMKKYGLSTAVHKTYLSDFHGMTASLRSSRSESAAPVPIVARCTDCHGVHDITKVDAPTSRVLKANLVQTCRQCHQDASESFPDAWLSHYEPSWTRAPLVYFVTLGYKFLIPFMIGGLILQILLHLWRVVVNR